MTATLCPAYELLAADIKAMGVESVFGLMSEDTALLLTALDAIGVRFIAARHENTAIAMAEGYASARHGLGIAILGRGPGTANALHAAVYANRSGSSVLLIFGQGSVGTAAPDVGPDAKTFDAARVLDAAGLKTMVASDASTVRHTLAEAARSAGQGVCTALLLPTNVQFALVAPSGPLEPAPASVVKAKQMRLSALDAVSAMLQRSRKPLFVVGLGAHRCGAKESISRLAERVGAVVATTLKAKDMFRGHDYNLGIIGSLSHSAGRQYIEQADCVLVFGASLNLRTTSYGASIPLGIPVAQVDTDRSHIGRWFHADIALVADARVAADQLIDSVTDKPAPDKPYHTVETRRRLADFDMSSDFRAATTARTMDPRALALELDALLPPDRNAVYDTGNFLQVVPYVSVLSPDHIKNSHDFASIGLGFGTALGFAHGAPGRTTVLFCGDGGFLMTMGELETVVREDIPLVLVLMNDCAYGAELHYLTLRNAPAGTSVFPDVDYAPVAQAFGFRAETIRTLDELRQLAPILRRPDGPIFLDCKITASVAGPFLLETAEYEGARNPR